MLEVDCRGLACPAPVLKTKEAIETEGIDIIKVIIDNEAAQQNVTRFLESRNFRVSFEKGNNRFEITGTRGDGTSQCEVMCDEPLSEKKKIMIMVATDSIGRGDEELGSKLMLNFLKTLKEMGDELWRVVFVNNGVKLTISEAETLPVVQDLEKVGADILVCGTCLDHFNLLDKKEVGETTNMLDIVTSMQVADKVVNI